MASISEALASHPGGFQAPQSMAEARGGGVFLFLPRPKDETVTPIPRRL